MHAIRQDAFGGPEVLKVVDVGGTHSRARRNEEVLMVKSALYAAIGFAAISSIALAEDLSSATAPFRSDW